MSRGSFVCGLLFLCSVFVACEDSHSSIVTNAGAASASVALAPGPALVADSGADVPARPVVIRAASMIDPRSGTVTRPAVVVVRGSKIEALGASANVPGGARVVELGDATLIPGLIDAHSHLLANYDSHKSNTTNMLLSVTSDGIARRALVGARNAREDLFAGITTVRDVGNSGIGGDVALRDAIAKGWVPGPRVVPCTRALSVVGGQFGGSAAPRDPTAWNLVEQEYREISGAEDARRAVREAFFEGAECIKVIVDAAAGMLAGDELRAIVDEAHRSKHRVAAHAVSDDAVRIAVDAGVDSIEHADLVSEATLRVMAAKKTFLVPTDHSLVGLPEFVRAGWTRSEEELQRALAGLIADHEVARKRLGLAQRLGVRIAAGSDSYYEDTHGLTRGQTSLMNLQVYAEAGMPPLEILRAATSSAADLLFEDPKVGSLAVGMTADLVALQGDPLVSAAAYQHVVFVMAEGVVALESAPH